MIIKTFIEPPIDNNNYLIIDEESKEAALIDCSAIDDNIDLELKKQGAKLKYILLTHGHFDHVAGIRPNLGLAPTLPSLSTPLTSLPPNGYCGREQSFEKFYNLPQGEGTMHTQLVMHKNDLGWLKKTNQYLPMFGMPEITIPQIDVFVEDGDTINLGNTEIKVIHTPGHTQGGVCYLTCGNLFSGDTIFREAVGRCDLEGGDFDQIVESIETKIFTLPEDTKIYPGHGKMTSVEWEK